MKLKIKRDLLLHKLQPVVKIINPRHTIPVLTGVKMDVDFENIQLTGSDSDRTLVVNLKNDPEQPVFTVEEPGTGVFPSRHFLEIIKKMPGDEVTVEGKGQNVQISSGKTTVKLQILLSDDYPSVPIVREENSLLIKKENLKEAFGKTMVATAESLARPILKGINVVFSEGQIEFIATDSHRLSKYVLKNPEMQPEEKKSIVVPTNGLDLLDQFESDIEVVFDDNKIGFLTENMTLYSRLLEGIYPDTSRIIPDSFTNTYVLHREEFTRAVDRALLFARELKNNAVRLLFDGQEVTVKVDAPAGSVQETLFAAEHSGEKLTIGLNAKYLLDGLRSFESETIKIGLTGDVTPCVLSEIDNPGHIHLILPLRLN